MITMIVLAVLGFALVTVLIAMFRAPSGVPPRIPAGRQPAPLAVPPPADLDPWEARKGDVISITGAAEDYSDVDFPVDRRSAYQSNNRRWVDLSGEFRGHRVYLEVYRYPQPDLIGIVDARKLTLDEIGVTEEQLVDMDTRQDPSAFIEFDGQRWLFEASRELGYFENEAGEGEGLYRWLFHEQAGPRLLCIEKWQGEPFDVRIARRLLAHDIKVYRAA